MFFIFVFNFFFIFVQNFYVDVVVVVAIKKPRWLGEVI